MTVLVTGGAGYIGSHACKALARAGWLPVAYDNLVYGHTQAALEVPLIRGDPSLRSVPTSTIPYLSSSVHASAASSGAPVSNCAHLTAALPVSVPANIAEGFGRSARGDYVHHLSIAFGSLRDLETHLEARHEGRDYYEYRAGEFWGARWNRGFRDLSHGWLFRPLLPRIGAFGATLPHLQTRFVLSGSQVAVLAAVLAATSS